MNEYKNNSFEGITLTQFDIIKLFLAVIVVLRHCGQSLFDSKELFIRVFNVMVSPIAVPMFFAISGFFFFRDKNNRDLKKYIYRLFALYMVWTLIYFPLILDFNYGDKTPILSMLIRFAQKALFDGTYFHLWYIPSLMFAIFFVQLLGRRINNNSLLHIGLLLYIVGVLVDTYSILFPDILWRIYNEVFLTTRNGLFFGFVFVVIGKLIAEDKPKINHNLLITGLVMALLESIYLIAWKSKSLVNMDFSSLLLVFWIMCLLNNIDAIDIDGKLCRNMSTIIFCIHPWYIVLVKKVINNPFLGTAIVLGVSVFHHTW